MPTPPPPTRIGAGKGYAHMRRRLLGGRSDNRDPSPAGIRISNISAIPLTCTQKSGIQRLLLVSACTGMTSVASVRNLQRDASVPSSEMRERENVAKSIGYACTKHWTKNEESVARRDRHSESRPRIVQGCFADSLSAYHTAIVSAR